MIATVWLAPGVAPFIILTTDAPVADAPLKMDKVLVVVFTPAPILTVAPAVVTLAIDTVVDPEPFAIRTELDVPEEEPIVMVPVWVAPPIRIVPVVILVPRAIVVVVPPVMEKALPAANVKPMLPIEVEPTFNTEAAAPVKRFMVTSVPVVVETLMVFVVAVFTPLNKFNV